MTLCALDTFIDPTVAEVSRQYGLEWPKGWMVVVAKLPNNLRGLTYFRVKRSEISEELDPRHFKATVIHEWVHAVDGPVKVWQEDEEERRVHRVTARYLISDEALLAAIRTTDYVEDAADLLDVPISMVWARLQGLSPDERAAIKAALGDPALVWPKPSDGRKHDEDR